MASRRLQGHARESEDLPGRRTPTGGVAVEGRVGRPTPKPGRLLRESPVASSCALRPWGWAEEGDEMQVRKRNGDLETVNVNKIVRAVERWVADLDEVDPLRVATKTISG